MKLTTSTALAATVMLWLALSHPAAAQSPPDPEDPNEELLWEDETFEDEAETQAADETSQPLIEVTEEAPPDDFTNASIVEQDDTVVAVAAPEGSQHTSNESTGKESEDHSVQSNLKRALLGVRVPAVERRIHKAVSEGEIELVPESEP